MNVVSDMRRFTHPAMPDVTVYAWEDIRSGNAQQVLVDVRPGGEVPLHRHSVDALMIIVAGEGHVLFDQDELCRSGQVLNKEVVCRGDIVDFKAGMKHGFKAINKGLTFISINGGIVDEDPCAWDMDIKL